MTWKVTFLFALSAFVGGAVPLSVGIFIFHDLDPKFASSPWLQLQVNLMLLGILSVIAAAALGIVLQVRRLAGRRRLDRHAPVVVLISGLPYWVMLGPVSALNRAFPGRLIETGGVWVLLLALPVLVALWLTRSKEGAGEEERHR